MEQEGSTELRRRPEEKKWYSGHIDESRERIGTCGDYRGMFLVLGHDEKCKSTSICGRKGTRREGREKILGEGWVEGGKGGKKKEKKGTPVIVQKIKHQK